MGQGYFNEVGTVTRFAGIAQEVTREIEREAMALSEARFRTLVEQAPVAMAIFRGTNHVIETVNEAHLSLWGRAAEQVLGKPLFEALPEVKGLGYEEGLARVLTTGEPFYANELSAPLLRHGQLETVYFNVVYQPLREVDGTIRSVTVVANEITEQVKARQTIEERETVLRNAIDLAELGTFSVDVTTNRLTVSPRVADWFGFEGLAADADAFISGVGESDREQVRTSLYNTLLPGSDGRYDVVHSVINAKTGHRRILHALGQVYFDAAGKPVKIEGTAQDVTLVRELHLALEQQVQQRTDELAAVNEELAASNEEYAAMNEELTASSEEVDKVNRGLEESNLHLSRSNQNLEQFAYIASHDLQEPLRKIQQFGDLLKQRYATSGGDEVAYLDRMQLAASRMSILIRDLLAFSRISTGQAPTDWVNLNQVVTQVIDTLSVPIEETGAHIQLNPLPTIQGDGSQLTQLFQNLLSNAIKFSHKDQSGRSETPLITIRANELSVADLPASVKPSRYALTYYRIDVTDNGIGFEEKYADRIFQVFQRLHGKNEFAGTGVGLAICEKVVTNHGGIIKATSQPGQGATFRVFLPT